MITAKMGMRYVTLLAKRAEEDWMMPLKRKTANAVPTMASIAMAENPFMASGFTRKTSQVLKEKKPMMDGTSTMKNPPEAT